MKLNVALILILTVLSLHVSVVQAQYQPGYVVTNNNDTIRGMGIYKEKEQQIIFPPARSAGRPMLFTVNDVKSFRFGDSTYVRFPIERDPPDIKATHKRQAKLYERSKADSVFFQLVIPGPAFQLFVHWDRRKERFIYFIKPKNREAIQLNYCSCTNPEHIGSWQHNLFREPLYLLAAEMGSSKQLLESIKGATIRDLEEVVKKMNGMPFDNQPKVEIRFFSSAAGGLTKLSSESPGGRLLTYNGSVSSIGFGVEGFHLIGRNAWGTRLELNVHHFQYGSVAFKTFSRNIYVKYKRNINKAVSVTASGGVCISSGLFSAEKSKMLNELFRDDMKSAGGLHLTSSVVLKNWEIGLSRSKLSMMWGQGSTQYSLNINYHFFKLYP